MNKFITCHMLFYSLLSYNYSPQTPPMESVLILPSSGCCHRVSCFPSCLHSSYPFHNTFNQPSWAYCSCLLSPCICSVFKPNWNCGPSKTVSFETFRRLLSVLCSSSRQSGELTLRNHEPIRSSDLQLPGLRLQPSHRRGQVALELPGLLPAVAPESNAGVTGVTAW